MKRFAIILTALLTMGCAKESEYATARFNCLLGNSMTKVTASEIREAVAETAEGMVPQLIFFKGGKTYTACDAGDEVTLPVGEIEVKMDHIAQGQNFGDLCFADEPSLVADTTFYFHSYTKDVTIQTRYQCVMLVFDKKEVAGIQNLDLVDYGDFYAAYVYGEGTADLNLWAPDVSDYRDRKVTIDMAALDSGKFYIVSTTGITENTESFAFAVADFENGGRI